MSDNDWPREAIVFRVAMGQDASRDDYVADGAIVEGIDLGSRVGPNPHLHVGQIAVMFSADDANPDRRMPMPVHPQHGYLICGLKPRHLIPLTAPARALHAIAAAEVEP